MYAYFGQALTPASTALETQNISGALSGAYSKKHYHITGDCSVASGIDVSFAAGSILDFDGDYFIEVIGQIQLNGTSGERITCKPSSTNSNNRWRGFRLCDDQGFFGFVGGENNTTNIFKFVDFYNAEKLQESGADYHRIRGAAIFAYLYENITIEDCNFYDCKGYDYGGTVYLHGETGHTTSFKRNYFEDCSAQNDAAGAWVFTHGSYLVEDCDYLNCTSGWSEGNDFSYTVDLSTNLFTTANHYMITGNIVTFAANSNAPTPCVGSTRYYCIRVSDTTFRLAASLADAFAGTAIDITAQASGTKKMKILQEYSAFDATVTITD